LEGSGPPGIELVQWVTHELSACFDVNLVLFTMVLV
jgi:hypothetical protein